MSLQNKGKNKNANNLFKLLIKEKNLRDHLKVLEYKLAIKYLYKMEYHKQSHFILKIEIELYLKMKSY